MSREAISTSIFLIATVVAVSAAVAAIFPTIRDLSGSYVSLTGNLNDKVGTDAKIIFIKVDNSTSVNVYFWVKNVGSTRISTALVNMSDIFIYSDSVYLRFSPTDARVNYTIDNGDGDNYWENGETLRFSIEGLTSTELPSGEYTLTLVLYNGVETSEIFSY